MSTLQKAATLDLGLTAEADSFRATVRITNRTGHKLPTGYPEGRRMWLNLQARDAGGNLLYQSCGYDTTSGVLTPGPAARVYEMHLGISSATAALLGMGAGPTFHFTLNDSVYKDNRIPPLGFTNAAFDGFGGRPVDPGAVAALRRLAELGHLDLRGARGHHVGDRDALLPDRVEGLRRVPARRQCHQHRRPDHLRRLDRPRPLRPGHDGDPHRDDLAHRHARREAAQLALQPLRNPFQGTLELALALPYDADVTLEVFDVSGRCVARRPAAAWRRACSA